ncbi:MAG: response regulator [Planctomycetes bacterium]|nr:response regulator [Planctomycetota bacterium]
MDQVPEILFVDDNPGDSELVEEAFRQYEVPVRFHKVSTGPQALAFLSQRSGSGEALPDLVLLDVNLPAMNGHQVLERIRADPALADIAVIMLSTSELPRDIAASERLKADSYVIKPVNWDEYLVLVRSFEQRIAAKREQPLQAPPKLPGLD